MKLPISGLGYSWLIDPLLSGAQKSIVDALKPGEKVLDLACGTGSLSIALSDKAHKVLGLDLDRERMDFANRRAGRKGIENLRFIAHDASDLSFLKAEQFDIAITSMSVHQFDPDLAIQILKEMKRIAPQIIVMDYNYLLATWFTSFVVNAIERMAGGDHRRNFIKYKELGGLDYFLQKAELQVKKELYISSAFRIVKCG